MTISARRRGNAGSNEMRLASGAGADAFVLCSVLADVVAVRSKSINKVSKHKDLTIGAEAFVEVRNEFRAFYDHFAISRFLAVESIGVRTTSDFSNHIVAFACASSAINVFD